ncbi:MAG TPA: carboxypeptidase regulatory-like domain-containing protein [Thermoanaerobaculia bacterium]|nr:carboxypeptidase regulatory-like domain-containing protein [Thermoanaerobaculia bacterium]
MKKFLALMFAASLVVACGKGKEPTKEAEEDDNAPQTSTVTTSGTTAAAPSSAPAAAAAASPDAATLTGTIKLAAAAPAMPNIQMSADPYCQSQHSTPAKDEEVVVGAAGELANVFVFVKNPPAGNFPPPATAFTLDQKGCQYHPHVGGVMVGQPLDIKNDDATLHNVHAMPTVNAQFNEGQPVQGMVSTKKFDKPELTPFRIKCDVHGWMKSWLAVMPHPFYAVSQMNGTFTIPNLPPGNYTIVAWHEKYGSKEQQVTVAAKESKAISFSF